MQMPTRGALRGRSTQFYLSTGPSFPVPTAGAEPAFAPAGGAYGESFTLGTVAAGGTVVVTGSGLGELTKNSFDLFALGIPNPITSDVIATHSGVTIPVPPGLAAGNYLLRYLGGTSPQILGTLVVALPVSSPTGLSANSITTTGFTANWGQVIEAVSYEVDISTRLDFGSYVAGYESVSVVGGPIPNTFLNVTALDPGTTEYNFRVRAVAASGLKSANSVVQQVSTASLFGGTTGAAKFNGNTSVFGIPGTILNLMRDNATFAFWIKPTNQILANTVLASMPNSSTGLNVGAFQLAYTADGKLSFAIKYQNPPVADQIVSTNSVPLIQKDTWSHVAFVKSGTNISIYHNGVRVGGGGLARNLQGIQSSSVLLSFGGAAQGSGTSWPHVGYSRYDGYMDDLRLYSSARTQAEIQQDLAGPFTGTAPAAFPVYAKFDSNGNNSGSSTSGLTVTDLGFGPGRSPGAWDIASGNYQLVNDGNYLMMELGGLTGTTLYDQIFVRNGAATLDGIVNLMFIGAYTGPVSGSWHTFDLIWAQNGIRFGDNYQLSFNQPGYTVDTSVVQRDGGELWQATVRQASSPAEIAQAAALAQPSLGVAQSPGPGGSVEMMYTYTRPTGGSYMGGQYIVGGVRYEVQASSDLRWWSPAALEEIATIPTGSGYENTTVRVIGNGSKTFLRLKISN